MNFSAEKRTSKWLCSRSNGRMVTIVAVLLAVGVPLKTAEARQSGLFPWDGLFGDHRARPRRAAHRTAPPAPAPAPSAPAASILASVPMPKPRPDEAPARASDKAEADKSVEKNPQQEASNPASVPLPIPRPAEQAALPVPAATGPAAQGPPPPESTAPAPPAEPPPPSACRVALTDAIAVAPSIPDIHGPGACGGEDLVRLEAVVLPDHRKVTLKPAATLRCAMASEIADWVRSDIAPLASGLGSPVSSLENYGSFDCRGRNGVPSALLSEHGYANALDVHAFGLADGRSIVLPDREVARGVREDVLHSMCKRFTTVLGPGSDGYHEDHIHLDLLQRRNNYTICEWNVLDPMPATAPVMPEPRPEEAPPRQVAAESEVAKPATSLPDPAKPDAAKPDKAKSDTAKSGSGHADTAKPDAAKPGVNKPAAKSSADPAKPRTRKKRR
jgi:hypothetical protein